MHRLINNSLATALENNPTNKNPNQMVIVTELIETHSSIRLISNGIVFHLMIQS